MQKLIFIETYGVSTRTKGKGVKAVQTFFGQEVQGGPIFRDFVRTTYINVP